MKKEKEDKMRIIPLGGLGAVGKNITVFEYNNEIVIVDCGLMFPDGETPGVDFIIPDFSYIKKHKKKVKGIIITHGHEDHIGAIPFLLQEINAPVYASKLSIGLIQSRLSERPPAEETEFIEIEPRDIKQIGSSFTVEFIRVNHSIVGGVGLAIQTDLGTIIHTGDFKIDFSPVDGDVTDIYRFADYGEKGVLLLMSDSTNAEKEGFTRSESGLIDQLIDIFSNSKGRIIVATFASNIHRIQQVLDVAQRFSRKVAISGYSMLKNIEISNSLGYLNFRDDLIINIEEANSLPNKKVVIICTGTQGEPMSALSRISNGTHRHLMTEKGDTVIVTASVIPGNERMVTNIVNSLMQQGAEVLYDQTEAIHVSGHGSAKELKLMISVTKPQFFLPIHGEYKHLHAHAKIAESLKIKPSRIVIAENGDILELTKKSFRKEGNLSLSQIYVDGTETGDVASSVIRDRHKMSTDGVILITVITSEGMLVRLPEIKTRGFIENKNLEVLELIKKDIEERVNKMLLDRVSASDIETGLIRGLKNLVFKLTRRNPLIIVQTLEV